MHRIIVSDDVARELGADRTHQLRIGDLVEPTYECLACDSPGDTRINESAAVLLVGGISRLIAFTHARCFPSAVHPISEFESLFRSSTGGPKNPPPGATGATGASVVQLAGVQHPAVLVIPGVNTLVRFPGSPVTADSAVAELRQHGFADLDFTGQQSPADLDRWAVRVAHGRLSQMTRPGGVWWSSTTSPMLDQQWRTIARQTRRVLVMVTGADIPIGDGQAATSAAMLAAASTGRLVAALMPIRGSLS